MTGFWGLKRVWLAIALPLLLIILGSVFGYGSYRSGSLTLLSDTFVFWAPISVVLLFTGYLKKNNNKELAENVHFAESPKATASFNFWGAQYSFIPGVSGEVLAQQSDYQYESQTTSGGGTLINGSGYIAPTTTTSTSVRNDNLWVACENGKEKQLSLHKNQVRFRSGHQIRTYHLLVKRNNENRALFENALVFNDNIEDHDIFIPVDDAFYKGAPRQLVAWTKLYFPVTLLSVVLFATSYYYVPICLFIGLIIIAVWGKNAEKSFSKAVYQVADTLAKPNTVR